MLPRLYACLGSGNCYKPWLAMNQLGLGFDLRLIDVLSGAQRAPDYLAINPLGVVPYLVLGDGDGIGESNAMLWYLAEGTDLMPPTAAARAQALQWMFFEQSRLEPFISPARFFITIVPEQRGARAEDIKSWQDAAKPGLVRLNTHLSTRRFMLAHGYSIADIAVFGYVHVMEEAEIPLSGFPHIARWIEDISQTPNFRPLSELRSPASRAA